MQVFEPLTNTVQLLLEKFPTAVLYFAYQNRELVSLAKRLEVVSRFLIIFQWLFLFTNLNAVMCGFFKKSESKTKTQFSDLKSAGFIYKIKGKTFQTEINVRNQWLCFTYGGVKFHIV